MKTIWKYTLTITDYQHIEMPIGAVIRTVQAQDDELCLWAEVDTEAPLMHRRYFEIFGTGHPIHYGMGVERAYLGTVQMAGLVWHVYERLGV